MMILLTHMYSLWTNQNHTKNWFLIHALLITEHLLEVEVKNKYDSLVHAKKLILQCTLFQHVGTLD